MLTSVCVHSTAQFYCYKASSVVSDNRTLSVDVADHMQTNASAICSTVDSNALGLNLGKTKPGSDTKIPYQAQIVWPDDTQSSLVPTIDGTF